MGDNFLNDGRHKKKIKVKPSKLTVMATGTIIAVKCYKY
jgi:hypothetical protein